MVSPEMRPEHWEPRYLDMSFTNVMAFSPTDTMPLSRQVRVGATRHHLQRLIVTSDH